MEALIDWLVSTRLSGLVMNHRWVWPISESLHFCGLTVLAGTVGLFDLRLLGLVKGVAPATLHQQLRWGMVGFAVSVITGLMFISGTPDQYFYNDAFKLKVVFLALMGLNAGLFYWLEFGRVRLLGPQDDATPGVKVIAALSLFLLATVICCGRMITFFRPPPY